MPIEGFLKKITVPLSEGAKNNFLELMVMMEKTQDQFHTENCIKITLCHKIVQVIFDLKFKTPKEYLSTC